MSDELPDEIDDAIANGEHTWKDTRTLYVVLQGEFALYTQPSKDPKVDDTLHIVAPNVPGHQYKAGPWLTDWKNQAELPCAPLRLKHAFGDRKQPDAQGTNVHSPRAKPENNLDIILSLGQEAPDPSDARVHITARMPLAILPGIAQTTTGKVTIDVKSNGNDIFPPVPPSPTLIAILVYKWYVGRRPYLWSPSACTKYLPGGPSENFLSLHVFASSPCEEEEDDPTHARQAFTAAAKLLGEEAYISFDKPFVLVPAAPPAGLSWAQVNMVFARILTYQPCDPSLILDNVDLSLVSPALREAITSAHSGNCGPITGG